jgi:tetratricopeptide (TPR) repeat protein
MNDILKELEETLAMQENYFDNLIELGLFLESSGQYEKAFDVYKQGLEKADQAKTAISGTMLGLL